MAATFMAAGEPGSATVQWLRLAPVERHVGEGLSAELVAQLDRWAVAPNETFAVAAALAARLGLERVMPIDDHLGDALDEPIDEAAYGAAITRAWDNPANAERKADFDRLVGQVGHDGGLLSLYSALNAPGEDELVQRSDFDAARAEPSEGRFGRRYVGGWEARNLHMAANLRSAMAERPGVRALLIVGASHKGVLGRLLGLWPDIELADSAAVLARNGAG